MYAYPVAWMDGAPRPFVPLSGVIRRIIVLNTYQPASVWRSNTRLAGYVHAKIFDGTRAPPSWPGLNDTSTADDEGLKFRRAFPDVGHVIVVCTQAIEIKPSKKLSEVYRPTS